MRNQALNILSLCLLVALSAITPAFAQSITIQGKVTDSSGQPILGAATQFRVQILAPTPERCVLYDETHTINLSTSYGLFSINLNNGLGTRNLPTTYSLEDSLSNRTGFAVNSSYCSSGSGTVTYSPAATDNRKLVIQFRDPGTMASFETIPEMDLNPVPYAIESRGIGGYAASSLLRVSNAGVPGTAPTLTSAQVTELSALIGGTSTSYMSSSGASPNGARLPNVAGNPTAPAAGSMWFDTGSGSMKYYDGSTVQTVGTGTGSGTITGVTTGTGLSGGGTTGTVTVSLGTSGVTAGTYGASNQVPVLTVDAYGRITTAGTTAITGTLPAGTAGQFLRSDGTNWTSQKITMADLKSTIGGADLFSSPGCTAAQSLYWDSGTDQLKCQAIGGLNAAAITAGTIANARLADVGTAGTYKIVTTDAKGRVTAGSNPTTLAGFGITDAVLNAGGIPNVSSGVLASRPAAASAGRLYVSTDNLTLYRDNGTTWDIIGAAGGGASITEITAGTGLTGGGVSGNVTVGLGNVGTAGTYTKITTDAQGRVTAGSGLSAGDIPNLDWAKITSGTPANLSGYGITDGVRNAGSAISLQAGTAAARPAFGTAGRIYLATDTSVISYDTGTAWTTLASAAGSGGDITDVVAGTGLSGGGTTGSVTLNLSNVGTAGTYAKVTTDAQGRVTSGATLAAADIPNLDWAKITSGTPTTLTGYGITDAVKNNGGAVGFQAGASGSRPAFGTAGRFYYSTNTNVLSYDTGTAWTDLTQGSSTITSVSVTAPITNSGTATEPNITLAQANGSTNGYLSSTDWTTFNNKLSSALNSALIWVGNGSNVATPVAPGGDVSMTNAGAFTVAKIQGTAVSSTAPTSGQFFTYNGTNWAGKNINLADLKSTSAGTPALFPAPGCTAAQALYWDSGTDQIKCQAIAIDAAAITSGTIDPARLPASVSPWSVASGNVYRSTGNVGIGSATPGVPLDVVGDVRTTTAFYAPNGYLTKVFTNSQSAASPGFSFVYSNDTGMFEAGSAGSHALGFSTAGVERLRINNTGSVGLGTTNPTSKLDIVHDSTYTSETTMGLRIRSSSTVGAKSLVLGTDNTAGVTFVQGMSYGSAWNGPLSLNPNGGNVGVGTISPGAKFDVYGDIGSILIGSETSGSAYFNLQTKGGGTAAIGAAGSKGWRFLARSDGHTTTADQNDFALAFYNGTSWSYPLWADSATGNLGVGVGNATAALHLKAGSAAAASAPFKFTAGTNLTTPEDGAMEYNGSTYYLTVGSTRYAIPLAGGAAAYTTVSAGAGAVGTPSYTFSGDTNTGFFSSAADTIGVAANGAKVFDFSSAGMISPTAGGANVTSANGTAAAPTYSFAGDPDTGWFRPSADTLAAATGGSERMRIDANGNVAIGTTVASDAFMVQKSTSGGFSRIRIRNPDAAGGAGYFFGNDHDLDYAAYIINNGSTGASGYGGAKAMSIVNPYGPITMASHSAGGYSERLRIDTSGNIGIGTSTIAGKLHISGANANVNSTPLFKLTDTTIGHTFGIDNGNNANAIRLINVSGQLELQASSTPNHLILTSTGKVGIGTSTPATGLELYDSSTTNSTVFQVSNPGTGTGQGSYTAYISKSDGNGLGTANNKGWYVGTRSNAYTSQVNKFLISHWNGTAYNEAITITPAGLVGIGTNTPSWQLTNSSAANFTSEAHGGLAGSKSLVWEHLASDSYTGYTAAFANSLNVSAGHGVLVKTTNTATGTVILAANSGGTDRFVVRGDGNVGIGTYNPGQQLELTKNMLLPYASGNNVGNLFLGGDTSVGTNGMRLFFNTTGDMGYIDVKSTGTNTGLIFRVDNSIGNVERMRIRPDGNVGIGYTGAAGHRLSVSAPAGMHGIYGQTGDTGSTYYGVYGQSGSYWGAMGRADGYAFVGTGNVWATGNGSFNQSDGRYKEHVTPLDSSLAKIMQLRPVSYTWKKDSEAHKVTGDKAQFGLIAQEVQKVIPDIVILNHNPPTSPNKDGSKTLEQKIGESYGVEYTKIVPFLIGAVQELKAQLDKLFQTQSADTQTVKRELASIKAENEKLKADAAKKDQELQAIRAYLCAKDAKAPICGKAR